jgi:exocyst complex component 3
MAAPMVSAAQAVGEYLQSPDDLVKIVAFRKKLEKEKASIDARLKVGVREQLEATREGLRKLFSTRNNVQTIKDEMETVDRLCNDPQNKVSTFDQISRVSEFMGWLVGRFNDFGPRHRYPWFTETLSKRRRWSTICSR